MSCKFIYSGTTVTLSDPLTPIAPEGPPRQRITYSGGGAVRVTVLGLPDVRLKPSFARIPNPDALALLAFITTTIDHAVTPFTFVSWAGVTYTNVRYLDGKDSWKMGPGGKWSGFVEMRVDLQ